jgi:hypothetical protein
MGPSTKIEKSVRRGKRADGTTYVIDRITDTYGFEPGPGERNVVVFERVRNTKRPPKLGQGSGAIYKPNKPPSIRQIVKDEFNRLRGNTGMKISDIVADKRMFEGLSDRINAGIKKAEGMREALRKTAKVGGAKAVAKAGAGAAARFAGGPVVGGALLASDAYDVGKALYKNKEAIMKRVKELSWSDVKPLSTTRKKKDK